MKTFNFSSPFDLDLSKLNGLEVDGKMVELHGVVKKLITYRQTNKKTDRQSEQNITFRSGNNIHCGT